MKNDAGFIERILPVLISTGIVLGIILFSGTIMNAFQLRQTIDQVARTYLLEMETKGYLEQESLQQLEEELKELGMKQVDLEGTTVNRAGYGERICLSIAGNLVIDLELRIPFVTVSEQVCEIPIHLLLETTAKH